MKKSNNISKLEIGYKIKVEEINNLPDQFTFKGNTNNDSIIPSLTTFLRKPKELNGEKLVQAFFPCDEEYDIFLSHSHNDQEAALKLKTFLSSLGFKVFLDSEIWGSADKLLKDIDNEFCRINEKDEVFSYEKRNFSTTHVHLLLTSALGEVIKNSSVFIFVESKSTVSIDEINNTNYTYSPWIYQELQFFSFLINNKIKISNENFNKDNFNIVRELDTSELNILSFGNLKFLKECSNRQQALKNNRLNWDSNSKIIIHG